MSTSSGAAWEPAIDSLDPDIDLAAELAKLKEELNAVVLAHYYQEAEIQDIADLVGDNVGLAQAAEKTSAEVIVFCGVHFMAETAKILNPNKLVLLPDLDAIGPIEIDHPTETNNPDGGFLPYQRDEKTLARPWAVPGTPGLEHRIGGLEKEDVTGNVSYEPDNHEHMVRLRAAKVQRAAQIIPELEVRGPDSGDLLLLGWGGTYGAITTAGDDLRAQGHNVSTAHLRYLNPFPKNLGDVLGRFKTIVIPEINLGQLLMLIRGQFLVDAIGINEVRGKMFRVDTLVEKTLEILNR